MVSESILQGSWNIKPLQINRDYGILLYKKSIVIIIFKKPDHQNFPLTYCWIQGRNTARQAIRGQEEPHCSGGAAVDPVPLAQGGSCSCVCINPQTPCRSSSLGPLGSIVVSCPAVAFSGYLDQPE